MNVVQRQFSNFSFISWWEQINYQQDDDEVCFVLDQHAELEFCSANSPRVDMSLHSDTLFWFRTNQSLLFLLNAACLAEKQQIPILVFGLTWLGLEPTIYCTRGEHTKPLHHPTDAVGANEYLCKI